MVATKRLNFGHGVAPATPVSYETDDMTRIQKHIMSTYNVNSMEALAHIRGYNIVLKIKRELGIKE